jgi:Eco57I restriction-modification methylase/restriction endonuclease TaqI-like protein
MSFSATVERLGLQLTGARFDEGDYNETALRKNYLDDLWAALGWDLSNRANFPQSLREVALENRVRVQGRQKRADYTFRVNGLPRLVCKAKRPDHALAPADHFQAQRYAYNLRVHVAVLSNFRETLVFAVGGEPSAKRPFPPVLRFTVEELADRATDFEALFSRSAVAGGALETFLQDLPKRPAGERGGWIARVARTRTADRQFLDWLDHQRLVLARGIAEAAGEVEGEINAVASHILNRLLLLRICEDRQISVGQRTLRHFHDEHGDAGADLYEALKAHFVRLRTTFNGVLFQHHPADRVSIPNRTLRRFLGELTDEDSPYLFSTMPVEVLGTVYERFLGRTIVSRGGGPKLEPTEEARRSGGVYYTPEIAVRAIVGATLGELVQGAGPRSLDRIRIMDIACGSGAFLVSAYQHLCEAYLAWYREHPAAGRGKVIQDEDGELRLRHAVKTAIATRSIYGVDIDPQAVEVTQLSLYLKMLEGETALSLDQDRQTDAFRAVLPDLSANIRCGNSVVDADYDELDLPADDVSALAPRAPFSWSEGFHAVMEGGGFDVVVGNPPYVRPHRIPPAEKAYFWKAFETFRRKSDLYCCFVERAVRLVRPGGLFSYIVSRSWLTNDSFEPLRRFLLDELRLRHVLECPDDLFTDAHVRTVILTGARRNGEARTRGIRVGALANDGATTFRGSLLPDAIRANYMSVFDLSQADPRIARTRARIERAERLGRDFRVAFGMKTGDDARFVHEGRRHASDEPLLTGEDVQRWSLTHRNLYVCYDPAAMRRHRATARPGERERFAARKVLVKDTAADLAAALDEEGRFVKDVLLVLPKEEARFSLEYVAGVINSRVMGWFFRTRFDTVHVQKHELEALPLLVEGRPDIVSEVERLAGKLTRMGGKDDTVAARAQRQLDEACCELYGMTASEREVVLEWGEGA